MDTPFVQEPARKTENSEWGAVIGIVIIVLLLIAGGIYFFLSGQTSEGTEAPAIGAPSA